MRSLKILVTNQKGGVGKSTIAANLAAYLTIQRNSKVNLIDYDRQSSSSKWISKAPKIGLTVSHANLTYENGGLLVLAEARRYLNKFSAEFDITISDLTWTHAMSLDFMLEYDIIIVPSGMTKFEMGSTEIFILEYIHKYYSKIQFLNQKILAVPSRVPQNFNADIAFLNLRDVDVCIVTPPIFATPNIDDFVQEDFLFASEEGDTATNFSIFGGYIEKLASNITATEKFSNHSLHQPRPTSKMSVLDAHRKAQQKKTDDGRLKWVPKFLRKNAGT